MNIVVLGVSLRIQDQLTSGVQAAVAACVAVGIDEVACGAESVDVVL